MTFWSKKTLVVFALILGLIGGYMGAYLYIKYPTISPLKALPIYVNHELQPHQRLNREVMGFLAYWRMDKEDIESINFNLLSELIYFSLSFDKDGNIVKVVGGQTEPGYLRWRGPKVKDLIAQTQIMGARFSVSAAMQDNDTIIAFLDSPQAQQTMINELKTEIKNNHLDGVNIDFEYIGDPLPEYRDKFTQFSANLSSQLKKESPHINLSIDVFPKAVRETRLVDVPKVSKYFDKVVMMAYDFYAFSSDTSGPTSPISGYAQNKFVFDINTAYKDFTKYLNPRQVILGVPYYGYDWPVENQEEYMSNALPQNYLNGYIEVLSYSRSKEESKYNSKDQCEWDELAQQPWCWYVDDKTEVGRQAWFENDKSIAAKFDFAKNKKMGGVAIWLLGYDRGHNELWKMVHNKFSARNF